MNRSGTYVKQPGGYKAFIPKPLPPTPPVAPEGDLLNILSKADRQATIPTPESK